MTAEQRRTCMEALANGIAADSIERDVLMVVMRREVDILEPLFDSWLFAAYNRGYNAGSGRRTESQILKLDAEESSWPTKR